MSKLWRAYVGAIESICCAGIGVILIISSLQVFARYALGSSLYWSEELMRYLMIWIVCIGAGLSFTRGQFLGMQLAVSKLPPFFGRLAQILSAVLILIFLGVVIWFGFKFAWGTRLQSATALGMSMFWVHSAIVVAGILLALHVAVNELLGIRPEPQKGHDMGAEDAL
ncbi:TRAP transporter small permease [Cypionkella sp.]|uniref:TRAP transporter small permease n=1 Tax=Cypionkella sp. TaxID=2811411 RepID=UPI002AB8498E|nr:TRAP transporter small permease [Cypionkella sp.]MDZ4393455.1 TRAP transporter small permease [Cypionkella sp.]